MLRRVGVGADQREDRVGHVGGGGPDLLAVDDVLVAVAHGARLEAAEVGAGAGLGVALRPRDLAGEDVADVLLLLLLGAVDEHRGAEQHHAGAADGGRLGAGHLLVEDHLLHRGEAGAAVLLGPVRGDPAVLGEGVGPLLRGDLHVLVGVLAVRVPREEALEGGLLAGLDAAAVEFGQPLLDEGRDLVAECGLLGVVVPVHGRSSLRFAVVRPMMRLAARRGNAPAAQTCHERRRWADGAARGW